MREKLASESAGAVFGLKVIEILAEIPLLRPWLYHQIGLIHVMQGRYDEAIACYGIALAQGRHRDTTIYHHLGVAQAFKGQLRAAEKNFRHAIQLQPWAFWSYRELGVTLLKQNLARAAEHILRQGLELTPNASGLHWSIADSLAQQGRRGEAIDYLIRAALAIPSKEPFTVPFPVYLLDKQNSTRDRVRALHKVLDLHPRAVGVMVFLTRALSFLGEYREATHLMQRGALTQWRAQYSDRYRRKEHLGRRKPLSFLIIGQAKAGTTALDHYLCRHPRIAPALIKEVHYWSQFNNAGMDWYLAHFLPIAMGSDLITGEASTGYFINQKAPLRIFQEMPGIQLILLLRDPAHRAYSEYQMFVRMGREKRSWQAVVDTELQSLPQCPLDEEQLLSASHSMNVHESYLLRSAALPFLQRWQRLFSQDRLLVLQNAELRKNTKASIGQVCRFLHLPTFEPGTLRPVNSWHYPTMSPAIEQRLQAWYQVHEARLKCYLDKKFGSKSI